MSIIDLFAQIWALLPDALWWVLGGLGVILFFIFRAEAR